MKLFASVLVLLLASQISASHLLKIAGFAPQGGNASQAIETGKFRFYTAVFREQGHRSPGDRRKRVRYGSG